MFSTRLHTLATTADTANATDVLPIRLKQAGSYVRAGFFFHDLTMNKSKAAAHTKTDGQLVKTSTLVMPGLSRRAQAMCAPRYSAPVGKRYAGEIPQAMRTGGRS